MNASTIDTLRDLAHKMKGQADGLIFRLDSLKESRCRQRNQAIKGIQIDGIEVTLRSIQDACAGALKSLEEGQRQTGRTLAMLREAAQVAPKLPPKMTVVVIHLPSMEAYCRALAASHGLDISNVRFEVPRAEVAYRVRTIQAAFVDHSCVRHEREALFWEAIDYRVRNPLVRAPSSAELHSDGPVRASVQQIVQDAYGRMKR
jgi:hypothetical protein